MDESTSAGGSSWESWIQSIGSKVADVAAANQASDQTYELQKLKIQQLGQYGFYNEGQAGLIRANGMGISSGTLLLLGAGLLAVMLLKD